MTSGLIERRRGGWSNHSIQPTGASRSGLSQFLHQRRLAPAADAHCWAVAVVLGVTNAC